jgi:hypothetical protein
MQKRQLKNPTLAAANPLPPAPNSKPRQRTKPNQQTLD